MKQPPDTISAENFQAYLDSLEKATSRQMRAHLKETSLRTIEQQQTALECLRLALRFGIDEHDAVARASEYLAFVTGEDADDAKGKLAAIRNLTA